ncbi:anti-repressor SinI family protein [Halobacillus naozhouensis]|uniref:Anti-repressor SinI family protein n=1 Tax=Halobacillus naozhouensis TaxID=554880 RepID=A0ABY8IV27_9BACI|nr:anti-repressor SinI family protein [Halobacillus naozhouensis]WFT73795.1 anti-repressor SinI family protein [Halobacillus naozhouensis]
MEKVESKRSLDADWIALIKQARDIGLTKEEIRQLFMKRQI